MPYQYTSVPRMPSPVQLYGRNSSDSYDAGEYQMNRIQPSSRNINPIVSQSNDSFGHFAHQRFKSIAVGTGYGIASPIVAGLALIALLTCSCEGGDSCNGGRSGSSYYGGQVKDRLVRNGAFIGAASGLVAGGAATPTVIEKVLPPESAAGLVAGVAILTVLGTAASFGFLSGAAMLVPSYCKNNHE
ncbi:MAG: hypothetical protein VX185_01215 [Pseudomonadota bacterium]|nr:hypothetical protein [Pseudomonadota bacterium]